MTTQEQFESAVENDFEKPTFTSLERDGDGYMDGYVDNAWWGWQACQEINNAERESIIAENAMMREALQDAEESLSRFTSDEGCTQKDFDTCDHVHHALANKTPRLVEVGRVNNIGQVEVHLGALDGLNAGTNVYTIQTDTKSVVKRKAIQRGE